ncbi:hypothetical protein BJF90_29970 [Pseudonocardia sp. CNS-004]|nr:hypothetical protein BJF90_29970 [Pseudonocardia sp. CNS-004]
MVLLILLRPDPLLLARRLAAAASPSPAGAGGTAQPVLPRVVPVAATVMIAAQLVMVAIMTMTPIHMLRHGHSLAAAGW